MADGARRGVELWEAGIGTPGGWLRLLAFGAVAGGVVGFLGYLGGDLLICLFNWTGMMVIGAGLAGLIVPPVVRMLRARGVPASAALAIAILAAALPVSLAAAGFGRWAWPGEAARMSLVDWYVKTALVEAMVVGLWLVAEARRRPVPGPAMASAPLPPAIVNDRVTCLQMEDHYVRVHQASGSRLELMPMADAIARYGSAGIRTHRSWWVAVSAVRAIERDGRNIRLRLDGGVIVPVARNRVAAIRALPALARLFPAARSDVARSATA
ncbi:LytTR family DNA-binding domain-containing protein [Sphingomonas asaccharolytica]|uniref:LytTR family DNA-binding domain-containing protein n=1 Tax=Sphingomonas asaccharolytica TaxID=40681 RepID=UPI00082E3249|nr:LytTR family DNA-binding domain-containing protein [Sphingomonas asaccharolytica]